MDDGWMWHSPAEKPFHIAGFPWWEEERRYRRLPLAPECPLPPAVDGLANCTAGGQIRFRTDSGRLALKVRLAGKADMNHMPATGQCGFDCYVGAFGDMVYVNTTKYDHTRTDYECVLFDKLEPAMRQITLYFPLYQGVEEVLVGLDAGAAAAEPSPYASRDRIVIYGTSITQGGCASRPGMAYPNIVSRKLNAEVINLGFSGSGKGEPEAARIVSAIPNPALLVLDYEANSVSPELLRRTLPEFIRIFRGRHPGVPIAVVTQIRFAREVIDRGLLALRLERKRIQSEVVQACREGGDDRIYLLEGDELLGPDFHECTVDGVHPTDLGFARMAERLAPALGRLCGLSSL